MNWWRVRLATRLDAGGVPRVDPVALQALQRAAFRDLLEMHMAQDALEEIADLSRREAEAKSAAGGR